MVNTGQPIESRADQEHRDAGRSKPKAYLVGGGIASLASAAYLIRDGGVSGTNIYIFEETGVIGGSLDGEGSPGHNYVIRGGRMFTEEAYTCMMPFITSQFMPRVKGDRPLMRPTGTTNIAFIGQYCELPDDVVFTVEYSVRSAQTAVYSFLKVDKEVSPLYKGQHDIGVMFSSLQTMFH